MQRKNQDISQKMFPCDLTFNNKRQNWRLSSTQYTFFRIIMLSAILTDFYLIQQYSKQTDLMYFTFWGHILCVISFSCMLFENLILKISDRSLVLSFWKISHFIYSLTLVVELFINGIFWFGMFPFAIKNIWGKIIVEDIVIDILEHIVPLALLIIDLHVNSVIIWNYAYMKYHFLLLLIYLPINIIYSLKVKPVYSQITYSNYLSVILIIGCIVAIPVCHYLVIKYCKFFKMKLIQLLINDNENEIPASLGILNIVQQSITGESSKQFQYKQQQNI